MESPIESFNDEKKSAYLYRILSEVEPHPPFKKLFLDLGLQAENQSKIWEEKIKSQGKQAPAYQPDFRMHLVVYLLRKFGPRPLRSILAVMKIRGLSVYASSAHATVTAQGHAMPQTLEEVGGRHHKSSGWAGNLRAGIFGINDGLVSNTSLMMGLWGASADLHWVAVTGVAGAIAGAFSMAAGEYVSVRSQREMLEYQLGMEEEELKLYPNEEAKELSLIYQARGIPADSAKEIANHMIANPKIGLHTLAREELGLNPDDLGSPWGAALYSFSAFLAGALLPMLPLLWKSENTLIWILGIAGSALLSVGALMSLFTGRSAVVSALRMFLIGSSALTVTYFLGKWLGAAI